MRILLTGPSGFLGSALARHWATSGHELFLLARPTSSLERLSKLPSTVQVLRPSGWEQVAAAVREALPDAIVHTACSYGRGTETPLDMLDANVSLGTALLHALSGIPRHASEPATFLNTGTVLQPEVSLYALSKTHFSAWGDALARLNPERIRFVDLRLQQMYGPGDDCSKFTTHVIEACRRNAPHLALTAGEQRRDFIHVDDVVDAYDRVLKQRDVFAASDFIDVGSGQAVTMRTFVELVKQISGATTRLDFGAIPYRVHEAMHCVADTTRLTSLHWRPRFSLADGLRSILCAPL